MSCAVNRSCWHDAAARRRAVRLLVRAAVRESAEPARAASALAAEHSVYSDSCVARAVAEFAEHVAEFAAGSPVAFVVVHVAGVAVSAAAHAVVEPVVAKPVAAERVVEPVAAAHAAVAAALRAAVAVVNAAPQAAIARAARNAPPARARVAHRQELFR